MHIISTFSILRLEHHSYDEVLENATIARPFEMKGPIRTAGAKLNQGEGIQLIK